MDVFITYKDTPRGSPDCLIKGVNEFAHNSGMRLLILRTEKRAYFINVDTFNDYMKTYGLPYVKPYTVKNF